MVRRQNATGPEALVDDKHPELGFYAKHGMADTKIHALYEWLLPIAKSPLCALSSIWAQRTVAHRLPLSHPSSSHLAPRLKTPRWKTHCTLLFILRCTFCPPLR